MDEKQAKQALMLSGDIPSDGTVQPHSQLIPPTSLELPVLERQRDLIVAIRDALGLPDVIKNEQINYQLSWCKWMANMGHDTRYAKIDAVKDYLRMRFLSDEGVADVIKAAQEQRK